MGLLDRFRADSSDDTTGGEQSQEQLDGTADAGSDADASTQSQPQPQPRTPNTVDDRDDGSEQLAANDPDPRGEHRSPENTEDNFSWLTSYNSISRGDSISVDTAKAPSNIQEYWNQYYKQFALTRASLKLFDDAVSEPGYKIRCEDADGERDEEMEEALKLWSSNSVIHAGEPDQDLSVLINQLPSQRRGKGTVFVEKVGTKSDPNVVRSLMMLDPTTMDIHKRDNQNLLVHPDDNVDPGHPTTFDDKAAAYEQYAHSAAPNEDSVKFTRNDIVKFVYDPDTGEAWGTSVFEAINDTIDSLKKKKSGQDSAILQTGWQHRIYSSENWSQDEAEKYAKAHRDGDVSGEYGPDDHDDNPFAGRVDFVPDQVDVTTVDGKVPQLKEAIMDDVQQIFSVMPVSRFKIAYEEDINQFVVEPQQDKDDRNISDERRYIERKLQPVLKEKADELSNDDVYEGTVHFSIEPPEDENPLHRESFPAENLQALTSALKAFKESNAEMDLPVEALFELAGIDLKAFREKYDWEPDPLAMDDSEDTTQAMEELESAADSSDGDGEATADAD